MRRLLTTAALGLTLTSPATAATLCVNLAGTGGCFASVQAAVDAAASFDVIQVDAGTYVENVTLPAIRNLTIEGAGAGTTVLQATGVVMAAVKAVERGTSVTLRGLTLLGSFPPVNTIGLRLDQRAYATLVECEIQNHDLGAVLSNGARLRLESSWLHDNQNGILFSSRTRVEVRRSTVSNNLFSGIAGHWGFSAENFGPPTFRMHDSTVSGNGAAGVSRVVGFISRSTITGNGTGIGGHPSSDLDRYRLDATILSANTVDCTETIRSKGYNFIGTACAAMVTGSGAALDLTGDDPMLGPLQDNGGPTLTHEPLAGSPVLEVVARRTACRFVDQRVVPRLPEPCDVGAHEVP